MKTLSNIKMANDYWYSNNMVNYTRYLEDTVWWNDRTMDNTGRGWDLNGENLGADIFFSSWGRGRNSEKLTCLNNNDRFTLKKIMEMVD